MLPKEMHKSDIEKILSKDISWEIFYGKTVLISGANGYVPSYFVYVFMTLNEKFDAGIKVIALCRNYEKASKKFEEYLGNDKFSLCIQDICDPISLNCPIHYFIHAASPAGINSRYEDPITTFRANVIGCDNMLSLAKQNACEGFLFVSSVDVYGKRDSIERLEETDFGAMDSLNIRNVYSCGKKAAEMLCCSYYAKEKLPLVIVRPFQIFGPGLALDDGRLHIDFISQILNSKEIVLKSDGSAKRTFLYITDAITAMFYAMIKGEKGGCYNIVEESGEATVLELANLMASNVYKDDVTVKFDYASRNNIEVTSAFSVVTGSSKKIKKLGWNPEYSLREGAIRMMQYYGIKTKNLGDEKNV